MRRPPNPYLTRLEAHCVALAVEFCLAMLPSPSVANFEKPPAEVQEILSKPIQQLGLRLEGSPLERFVLQLYKELEAKGLKRFRPKCYLPDGGGGPDMGP